MTTAFRELDTVILLRDMPEAGLHAGDLGAVVLVYAPDALEVEFVDASGMTLAVETLSAGDVRAMRGDDLLACAPSAILLIDFFSFCVSVSLCEPNLLKFSPRLRASA